MAHVFQNCLHIFGAPNTFYCSVKNTGSVSTLLLDSGAHISSHDSNGLTPLDHLTSHPAKLNVMKYTSLKCLAVNVLVENNARLEVGDAPQHCIEFYRDQLWGNKLLGSLLSKYKSGFDLWRDGWKDVLSSWIQIISIALLIFVCYDQVWVYETIL